MLITTDSGATWTQSPTEAALGAQMNTDTFGSKLYTCFALDATHLWVGGERGALYASVTGGK